MVPDEHYARSTLSRDFVLLFAGRLPVSEGVYLIKNVLGFNADSA
nr:host cell division inhibitor Icd-like protein [Xenorhabdus miraniensis]